MAEFSKPKASNPHNFTVEQTLVPRMGSKDTTDPRMGGKVTETIHITLLLEVSSFVRMNTDYG